MSLTLIAGLPLHLNAVAGLISLLHVTCLLVQRRLLAQTNLRGGVLMWHLTPSAEPCCVRRRLGQSSAFTPSIIRIALLAPTLHRCRATQPSHRRLAARSRTNSTFTAVWLSGALLATGEGAKAVRRIRQSSADCGRFDRVLVVCGLFGGRAGEWPSPPQTRS